MEKIDLVKQEYNLACHSHIYKYLYRHGLLQPEVKKDTFNNIRSYIPVTQFWLEDKIIPNRRAFRNTTSDTYPFRAWEYLTLCYVFKLPLNPWADTIYTMKYNESSMFFDHFETIERSEIRPWLNRSCCNKFKRFIDTASTGVGISNQHTIRKMQQNTNRHTFHVVEVEEITGMKNLKQTLNPTFKKGMYVWEYMYLCETFGLSLNPCEQDALEDIEIGRGIDFGFDPTVNVEQLLLL